MKKHFTEPGAVPSGAHRLIVQRCQNGIAPTTASEWFLASEVAWRFGVHCGPPPTPIHDEIERRIAAGDEDGAGLLRARMQIEWSTERRALARWKGMDRWLNGPSREEQAAAAAKDRAERERGESIEQRTQELIAAADDAARTKRIADARRQAEKEVGR